MSIKIFPLLWLSVLAIGVFPWDLSAQNGVTVGFDVTVDPDTCEAFILSNIQEAPIIRPDMPTDVSRAYIALDSLCRNMTPAQLDSAANNISFDSLEIAFGICNRMMNYDPLLFELQWRLSRRSVGEKYKSDWSDATDALLSNYYARLGTPDVAVNPPRDSLNHVVRWSQGIYRIKINSTSVRADSGLFGLPYYVQPCMSYHYCYSAEVVSAFYGWHWYPYQVDETGTQCCIQLSHEAPSYNCAPNYYHTPMSESDYLNYTENYMEDGKEYLVFVEYLTCPSFAVDALHRYSGGITRKYKIVDGMISNHDGLFGPEDTVSITEIEAMISSSINENEGR